MSETELSIPNRQLPDDMRTALMATPADHLPAKLAEIDARRLAVRKWMQSQMKPGVHFGVPPGVSQNNTPGRWESKPSLYQSGADFVIEAENLRPEFVADEAAARMLGNLPNMLIYACKLYSRITGELLGEGRGACKIDVSDKQKMDALNKGVKMACKRAKVAAVLNTYGLSDLFTQDIEDQSDNKGDFEAPDNAPDAAKAPKPRSERMNTQPVTKDELKELIDAFKADRAERRMPGDKAAFQTYVQELVGMQNDPTQTGSWMRPDFERVLQEVKGP